MTPMPKSPPLVLTDSSLQAPGGWWVSVGVAEEPRSGRHGLPQGAQAHVMSRTQAVNVLVASTPVRRARHPQQGGRQHVQRSEPIHGGLTLDCGLQAELRSNTLQPLIATAALLVEPIHLRLSVVDARHRTEGSVPPSEDPGDLPHVTRPLLATGIGLHRQSQVIQRRGKQSDEARSGTNNPHVPKGTTHVERIIDHRLRNQLRLHLSHCG